MTSAHSIHPPPSASNVVRVPKTAELVARTLRRQIVRGDLSEGDALPSETQLMTQFGVSRPTLREAFRVLESEALITVRRGSHGGARVHEPSGDVAARYAGLVLEHQRVRLVDVYEARAVIEPPCAGMLARRHTPRDLTRLRQAIEEAEAADADPAERVRRQTEFHSLIVSLAGNATVAVLSDMLRHILSVATLSRVATVAGLDAHEAAHQGGRSHRRLLRLVEDGDAEGAERIWRRHLEETAAYLLQAAAPETVLELLE